VVYFRQSGSALSLSPQSQLAQKGTFDRFMAKISGKVRLKEMKKYKYKLSS
jgi:hypothetical protein